LAWNIEALTKEHHRQQFDCGDPDLNMYLWQQAGQHSKKNISRVYVAVNENKQIIGFYTLSSAQINFEDLSSEIRKGLPSHCPIPATRLGRLAVDRNAQGQGVGESLLLNALFRCSKQAQEIATVGVVVEAKHEKAKTFYTKYGFVTLTNDPLNLILPIKTIIDILEKHQR
jgi:predicted GNAT family N-acyltransferase